MSEKIKLESVFDGWEGKETTNQLYHKSPFGGESFCALGWINWKERRMRTNDRAEYAALKDLTTVQRIGKYIVKHLAWKVPHASYGDIVRVIYNANDISGFMAKQFRQIDLCSQLEQMREEAEALED